MSALGSVLLSTIQNDKDGMFDLKELANKIRGSDIHEPITSMVAIENTHNVCGGKVRNNVFSITIFTIPKF